ncbi:hypothetical protein GCM10011506_21050 [Marivirga lumbricoides]|uniref:GH16 domain-containing protein n=1 Tax=Marivirga lumbricoides TaxID=1046115 RepID=A0ABQ1M9U4_9BACT|nr:hypothetical protein GCM10011506_21050 [Marivirga lumbricoides]
MKIRFLIPLFSLMGIFLTSCGEDTPSAEVILPSNLVVSVVKSESNPAEITLTASAERVNFYTFNFGDSEEFIQQNSGQIKYVYSDAGDYQITARAHTTQNDFISTTEQVQINLVDNEPDDGYTTPLQYEGYDLVWQDEFEGSQLSSDWTPEIGTGGNGWGNNELQYYRAENTTVGGGYLTIEAKEESFSGSNYTSSRLITKDKQDFQYGRIDIRAILPFGQGVWPALWMLGANFDEVGWPRSGEIDIMEKIGGGIKESQVFGTLHWDNNGQYACTCGEGSPYQLSSGTFADEFHVFSLLWDEEKIQWLVDDNVYHTIDISPQGLDEFRKPFFFIFNVAVGGNLPGSPDATTQFPQKMIVDYVRVFQEN